MCAYDHQETEKRLLITALFFKSQRVEKPKHPSTMDFCVTCPIRIMEYAIATKFFLKITTVHKNMDKSYKHNVVEN